MSQKSLKEIKYLLDDLLMVGIVKPLGYLPLSTITDICGCDADALERLLQHRGLGTIRLTTGSLIRSGALYAWDEAQLGALLQRYARALNAVGLSTECKIYVGQIDRHHYLTNPVYGIIAESFGEPAGVTYPRQKPRQTYRF